MSGRVLDASGAPVAGAAVRVNYNPVTSASIPPSFCYPEYGAQRCSLSLRTDDRGGYAVEFEPQPWPNYRHGFMYVEGNGYEIDVQWVPDPRPTPVVQDMRLRASRVLAGQSAVVLVEPTSSLCTDLEDLWAMGYRCEMVIIESGPGTLTVEARPAPGSPAPSMFWYTTGNYAAVMTQPAPGIVSIPAGGGTYRVLVAIPEGTPSQQFNVTTSLK